MKRRDGETFEDYKLRRTEEQVALKQKLKGEMVWYSKNFFSSIRQFNQGTYVKPKEIEGV